MVRAPCCEKMGLKKGPWTPEEDRILIYHIQKHGHSNWRALPKQAGLLRCGKSCRLRWINYLRPDIKRGNFSKEEEETIINLHKMLGNRWSAIAAKLPGRTDNEIKNVWHTHLKKRLRPNNYNSNNNNNNNVSLLPKSEPITVENSNDISSLPMSPDQPSSSSSDVSTMSETSIVTAETTGTSIIKDENYYTDSISEIFPVIDKEFWSEPESFSSMELNVLNELEHFGKGPNVNADDGMNFWYNVFVKAGGIDELL